MNTTTSIPTALLSAPEVLSRRHTPSMLLLALGAGAVNAGALAVCERFVTHVTGTATRIGADASQWLLMLEYSMVLAAFIAGAMASVLAIQGRTLRGKRPLHSAPLLGAVAILLAVAALGTAGAFGPVGGRPEETANFVFLSVLAFGMGLLNAGVASSTALSVRTTHMTGPATDFGVSLATAWLSEGEMRRQALQVAGLRGGKVASFIVGAALMFPLVGVFGYGAFAAPAGVLLFATVRSFMPAVAASSAAATPNTSSLTGSRTA
jgi:uncharacterized membrane protein YoaK (UPF0700 family)